MKLSSFIGDRAFYKKVISVSVPIMIQTGITNFVGLLDNIMVGRLGTEPMSAVSIVNQFLFVFNLLVFGAVSAAGIFTAQYHGRGDVEGVQYTFRFKHAVSITATVIAILIFFFFDEPCISLFLYEGSAEGDLALTLAEGKRYLFLMLFGLIPYAVSQVYSSTLRETGESILPMVGSIVAVAVNFVLNGILIFGLFGCPALGVTGAAIATVISRFAEAGVLIGASHARKSRSPFLVGVYRSLRIPRRLIGQIALRGLPLMLNEMLWALAVTLRNQAYATRGLDAVAADNICVTVTNVFSVVYLSLGTAVAILMGNLLGAGEIGRAKEENRKLLALSVGISVCLAGFVSVCAFLVPHVYRTTAAVRELATYMMLISALMMPFGAFANACYYTIRSGGKIFVTMLFDSVFMWVVVMPTVYLLSRYTAITIRPLFFIGQGTEVLKALLGYLLLRRGDWARSLMTAENK